MLTNFSYLRPKTVKEAVKALSSGGAVLHAGGTDLLGCLRDHVSDVKKMVSISGLKELKGIMSTPDGGLRIGALTTITEVAESRVIRENYTALAQAAQEVASPQLRNQGTLGGNLCQKPRCWYYRGEFHCLRKGGEKCFAVSGENQYHCILGGGPCFIVHPSDTAPALAAFDAHVRITGPKGARTVASRSFACRPAWTRAGRPCSNRVRSSPGSRCRLRRGPGARTARCAPGHPGISPWPDWPWRSASTRRWCRTSGRC